MSYVAIAIIIMSTDVATCQTILFRLLELQEKISKFVQTAMHTDLYI